MNLQSLLQNKIEKCVSIKQFKPLQGNDYVSNLFHCVSPNINVIEISAYKAFSKSSNFRSRISFTSIQGFIGKNNKQFTKIKHQQIKLYNLSSQDIQTIDNFLSLCKSHLGGLNHIDCIASDLMYYLDLLQDITNSPVLQKITTLSVGNTPVFKLQKNEFSELNFAIRVIKTVQAKFSQIIAQSNFNLSVTDIFFNFINYYLDHQLKQQG